MRIVKRRQNPTRDNAPVREAKGQLSDEERRSLLWDVYYSIEDKIPYFENMKAGIDEVIFGEDGDPSGTLVDVYNLAEHSAEDKDLITMEKQYGDVI